MMIATCGHEVQEGISCSIDDYQYVYDSKGELVSAITYGTYCAACVVLYHLEGRLLNKELIKLLENK